ncbi:uncharacterized protein PV09_02403 [Verruconis gallopava]|uniref:Uncharacterized protein n=1 Tax=Verruconis gallopava TaxID=253628 RepID=A0A0D2AII7_9PEZI|nr:uncharacterized protein PV09_02403 [Verruconis gallopava]KIW06703.1 hypothetical protein PV09_02403 [Verruconis gallopava]
MDVTCADTVSYNGILQMNLTGTIGSDSYYACAFLSNYTLAQKCCAPEKVHSFDEDKCYSWCDMPASMNDEIDTEGFDLLDYMRSCLNQTGETIGPLWCRLTQAHAITSPNSISTDSSSAPTSTFSAEKFCATEDPQTLISVNDPWAACGTLPNNSNHLALEACCQPAPVKWSVVHCYEYCYLPRGNAFRGLSDSRNLTDDQILGSFKTCMLQKGNGTGSELEGLVCRVNGSAIDLKTTAFQTDRYLTGGGITSDSRLVLNVKGLLILALSLVTALAFLG